MYWLLLIIIISLFVYLYIYKPLKFWENKEIPYIKPWPLLGNFSPFVFGQTTLSNLMEQIYNAKDKRYFGIYQFTSPKLVIKDIELVKHITIKDFEHFVDHKSFFNESNEPVFSENLFASKGQNWRDLRTLLSPVFTGSKMRSMYILISECSERFTNHFLEIAQDNKPIERELKELYTRFTIDVIGTCVFGIESDSLKEPNNDFYKMGRDVSNFSGIKAIKAIGFMAFPSLMRFFKIGFFTKDQVEFVRNIVKTTIEYREQHGIIRPDLIHMMMQARKGQLKYEENSNYSDTGFATVEESDVGKNGNAKLEITDNLIVAQAMVFFLGGVDTNSSTLGFISYELAVNPDIQRKLQDEIDEVFAANNGKVTYEVVTKMKYLDMVICETLRKWPQAFFLDRLCVKDYTVQPKNPGEKTMVIEKGQNIWIPVAGFHKDPKLFPNPENFDPERFSDENRSNINPYVFLPFGQGPRSCIGNRFALLVIKTFLLYFLHKFDIVVVKKTEIPLKLSKSQIVVNAANGFWLGFQKRSLVNK